jgi:trehalose 6-phosphate phosphatase
MRHVFSEEGRDALRAVMSREPFLAFDFDGTLAPIVAVPEDARASAAVARRLAALSSLRPVAIITGRRIEDVRPRLGFAPQFVIGNHGAEWEDEVHPAQQAAALAVARERCERHADELGALGVWIEDKGLSLAFHYRGAPDADRALGRIRDLLASLPAGLDSFDGKCVVNVVATGALDKGGALLRLVERTGAGSAVFIGDDVNDEAVFAIAPPHWLTVRVGAAPGLSAARWFLATQDELPLLLQERLELLRAAPARA